MNLVQHTMRRSLLKEEYIAYGTVCELYYRASPALRVKMAGLIEQADEIMAKLIAREQLRMERTHKGENNG